MRPVVRTHVRGLDTELGGGVPAGHVVLLRGASGTMKSSLAYAILYQNALKGVKGLYVTLEQDAASLLNQMAALGFKPASVSDSLPILDLGKGRAYLEGLAAKVRDFTRARAERPLTAVLKAKIEQLRKEFGFDLLVIDSWSALELVLEFEDRRRESFEWFEWLRGLGTTTFLIAEAIGADDGLEEEFLSDAIFRLRLEPVTETAFQRRIQCSKMRSANHSTDFFTLVFDGGHFEVAKAIS